MDQLKVGLAQAAKHQFWILTGVGLLLGIVGFYLTSSTLNDLFAKQKSAIESQFSNIQNVSSAIATHPNDISQAEMQTSIDAAAKDVEAAWKFQYERQAPILVWPEDIDLPTLVQKLKKYRPIELELEYPVEPGRVNQAEKDAYGRYFDKQMPKLAEIIGVTWVGEASASSAMAGMGSMGGGGMTGSGSGSSDMGGYDGASGMDGMGGMGGYAGGMGGGGSNGMLGGMFGSAATNRDIVIWPKPSQDELLTSIRLWRGGTPSVYEIMYTQENMWILEGLLNIIKKTNGNAKANFQTAIKEIEFLRIGRPAVGQAGSISGGPAAAGGGSGYEDMMGAAMGGSSGGSSMSGGMSGEDDDESGGSSQGAVAVVSDPANLRYVDAAFTALTGDDLRTKMRSESPEDAYFAVAKRVPVRLRLLIDQRKVQSFLATCGNADLMLEIRQVRIGDTVAAGGASAGGYGSGSGGGGSKGPGSMGSGGGTGMDLGDEGDEGGYGSNTLATPKKDPWLTPVEVYGVVYLFNPVNIDRLGLNKVTENTQVEDTVESVAQEVTAPAANPPVSDEPATDQPAPTMEDPAAGAATEDPAGAATDGGAASTAPNVDSTNPAGDPASPAVPGV